MSRKLCLIVFSRDLHPICLYKDCGTTRKGLTGCNGTIRREKKENKNYLKEKWLENFPKLMLDPKTTDPGNSENTKQDKYPPQLYPWYITFNFKSQRLKKKTQIGQNLVIQWAKEQNNYIHDFPRASHINTKTVVWTGISKLLGKNTTNVEFCIIKITFKTEGKNWQN